MTLEETAAMAMQGMLANPQVIEAFKDSPVPMTEALAAAALAYAKALKAQIASDLYEDVPCEIINE